MQLVQKTLPTEIWVKNFLLLNPKDLDRASLVCKLWLNVTRDERIWRIHCKQISFASWEHRSWRRSYIANDAYSRIPSCQLIPYQKEIIFEIYHTYVWLRFGYNC